MKITPSLEEARRVAQSGEYRVLPVHCEMLSDRLTPIECLRILKRVSKHCYLLESAADSERWGRYTFLGFDPALDITCLDGEMKVGSPRMQTDDPSGVLRQILADYRSPRLPGLPPFTGGLVGYFAFDYLGYSEPSVRMEIEDSEHFQDVDVMLFDKVIAFDHFRQKIILIVNMRLDDVDTGYSRAALELRQLRDLLLTGERWDEPGGRMTGPVEQLFSRAQYCDMVERGKRHIREGDIFQIVLSNRLSAPFEGSLLNAYRILRTINPSPYMFYFSGTDVEVAGASPETLVKLEDGVLHTFPLAGTRPRGKTEAEDAGNIIAVARELTGRFPILGVCLGHQAICAAFGATVTYAKRLMHGKQFDARLDRGCPLFAGLPEVVPVARYHSLAADPDTLPDCLKVTAMTGEGEVMAIQHRDHPTFGVQFHPESILTPDGRQMLKRFIEL